MDIDKSQKLRQDLVNLVRSLSLLEKSEASCCGITLAQCHAIVEIGRAGEIYLNKLADLLKLDKSTMSRTVDNLVNQGYVTREIDPENRKYIKIRLTDKGYDTFNSTEESMKIYYRNVLNSIAEEKRDLVSEGLELLLDAIKDNA